MGSLLFGPVPRQGVDDAVGPQQPRVPVRSTDTAHDGPGTRRFQDTRRVGVLTIGSHEG